MKRYLFIIRNKFNNLKCKFIFNNKVITLSPLIKDPTFIVFIFFVFKTMVSFKFYGKVSSSFIVFKNDKLKR